MNALTHVLVVAALAGFAVCLVARFWRPIAATLDRFLALKPLEKAVFVMAVTVATVCAQKPSTNAPLPGMMCGAPPPGLMCGAPEPSASPITVTPVEIARGWLMTEVRTNEAVCYAMPDEAELCMNWWRRGACEDVTRADLGNRGFILGGGFYTSLWAHTWGVLRPHLRDASNEIVAVGVPMSAVPCVSRFWTGNGGDGTRLITWENFFLGRDTNTPVNAQVELDYEAYFVRSNEIERVYQRIDPDDWDGDDVPNAWDPNPYVGDGIETDLEQVLPEGANEDAYCWVDLTSERHTRVSFTGDGYSNLPDPSFMLRSGDVCRVALLIGKTYTVTSDQPLCVVDQSDCNIEIEGDGTTLLTICWPVEIYAIEGNGAGFMMDVSPWWLGGTFNWTSTCCAVTGYGDEFWYACRANCSCGGCCVEGDYVYEGYSYPCCGGWCDCPHDEGYLETVADDGPWAAGATVSFSQSAVIFEEAYTNRPGEVVNCRSTRTKLTCVAHGGEHGGIAAFSLAGRDKLVTVSGRTLPVSQFVPPGQKLEFEIVYQAIGPSDSARDIVASAEFVDRETEVLVSSREAAITSVRVEIRPNDLRVGFEYRHLMGIREKFYVSCYPEIEGVRMQIDAGWGCAEESGDDRILFVCPIRSANDGLTIRVADAVYVPLLSVIEPTGLVCPQGTVIDMHYGLNHASGIGMALLVYVTPDYVSFSGIKMMELPVPVNPIPPEGYFTNEYYSAVWSHTTTMGAGRWHQVLSVGNFMFEDEAKFGEVCLPPWDRGQINWSVPIVWGALNAESTTNVVGRLGPYNQIFSIDPIGTVGVEKFGQWVKRTPSGTITHSDDIQNPEGENP